MTTFRKSLAGLVAALFLALPMIASGQVVLDTAGAADGKYYLEVTIVGGKATVRPLDQVMKLGQLTPTDPTDPPPTDPNPSTPFEAEIERITKTAIAGGGTQLTGAALSNVYSIVSDEVSSGGIAPEKALQAVSAATTAVLAKQTDSAAWAVWRTSVHGSLTTLAQQGMLRTKDQYAQALKEVSRGVDRASGNKLSYRQVLNRSPVALGILDGIDLAKLVELIKLIIELMKAFSG